MPQYKCFHTGIQPYGEEGILITTAYEDSDGYPIAEYYLLIPDEANTLYANQLRFDVKSFEGSPVELNEEFMLMEAQAQARIDLSQYLQQLAIQGKPAYSDTESFRQRQPDIFVRAVIRGTFPQLRVVCQKTRCQALLDALVPILKLPKLIKQKL